MPLIKREIVLELYKKHKVSPAKIARILNITRGSVSQYLKGVRGYGSSKVRKSKESSDLITALVEDILKKNLSESQVVKRFCDICRANQKVFCGHASPPR